MSSSGAKRFLVVLALSAGVHAARKRVGPLNAVRPPMELVRLPEDLPWPGKCMLGGQAGYYYRAGLSDVWVLWLEGGGACGSAAACEQWSANSGSLEGYSETTEGTHWRSADPNVNPTFWDAHHISVPYCTADTHLGQVTEIDPALEIGEVSEDRPWGNYYFDGHSNLRAIIAHLARERPAFKNMARMLFSGGSAGGVGCFMNCDWMASHIQKKANPDVQVSCAPDSGLFVPRFAEDNPDTRYPPTPFATWLGGDLLAATTDATQEVRNEIRHKRCVKHLGEDKALCSSVGVVYPFIQTPMFIIQNMYDYAQIRGGFGVTRVTEATVEGHDYMAYYGRALRNTTDLVSHHPAGKQGDGLFLASCYEHSTAPDVSGTSAIQALSSWFSGSNTVPRILVDTCEMTDGLPCGHLANPQCAPAPPLAAPCPAVLYSYCGRSASLDTCERCVRRERSIERRCSQAEMDSYCGPLFG